LNHTGWPLNLVTSGTKVLCLKKIDNNFVRTGTKKQIPHNKHKIMNLYAENVTSV